MADSEFADYGPENLLTTTDKGDILFGCEPISYLLDPILDPAGSPPSEF